MPRPYRLCDLSLGAKIGLLGLLATLGIGMVASLVHMRNHYAPRDGDRSRLTYTDIASAYHGVRIESPLRKALLRGHPPDMPEEDLRALLAWLDEPATLAQRFDDDRLGDMSPAEIIDRNCLSCHGPNATEGDGIHREYPLFFFDDVQRLAVSRDIPRTPDDKIILSMHAHALTLAVQSIVLIALMLGTRLPGKAVGVWAALLGLSLLADISSWWLARNHEAFVMVIIGAGGVYSAATGLGILAVAADLVIPRRRRSAAP